MGMTDFEKRALNDGAPFMETLAAPIPDACRISGGSKTSTTPATLEVPTQGPTQLKIWTPNTPTPARCIWVTLE